MITQAIHDAAQALVARTTAAQSIPTTITDPGAIARIASMLATPARDATRPVVPGSEARTARTPRRVPRAANR